MNIALVHDFLIEYGGAERVLEAMHEMWPEAPIYTAFLDKKGLGSHWKRMKSWDIRTSWGQRIPGLRQLQSPLRFLAPSYFWHFDLSKYEVVISSTNAYFAKAVNVSKGVHICYCHTPARSLYGYPTRMNWKNNFFVYVYGSLINHYLRMVDWRVAQKVDYFVANSREVQGRIRKFYRRESKVIYPPVKLANNKERNVISKNNYYLYVGKLAVAKHVDLAVMACRKLKRRLLVVGSGRELRELGKISSNKTKFLGNVDDGELSKLYAGCKAVIFPAEEEDFGIVPVEAMSFGKPVIAHRSGGVIETVIEGITGVFFDELSVDGLTSAIENFEKMSISRNDCIEQAGKFSKDKFCKEIKKVVEEMARKK